ncbi:MAG: polysaccharide deacetylase family protein [Aeromonadaceae bacterium]
MRSCLLLLCVWCWAGCLSAALLPPALMDRTTWPERLTSHPGFNAASRLEILTFANELLSSELISADEWPARLGLTRVDMLALERYRQQTWLRVLHNYQMAARDCPSCPHPGSVSQLRQLLLRPPSIPPHLQPWQEASRGFHAAYLLEQLRLAAQFSRISSEIDTLSPAEMTGNELMDGEFLLTFDDGPTETKGNTRRTAEALALGGQNGVFFLLGERLQARLLGSPQLLAADYGENCIASHGMRHTPYPNLEDWQESLQQSRTLLQAVPGVMRLSWFRPPYGQRTPEMAGRVFRHLVLWNIDSQDWRPQLSAAQVRDRVLTLMLLWRKGIILFHDVHPLAAEALPGLFSATLTSPVRWVDCHSFAAE